MTSDRYRKDERWSFSRKAEVVVGVEQGHYTMGEACERHGLTFEELQGWINRHRMGGARALRAKAVRRFS